MTLQKPSLHLQCPHTLHKHLELHWQQIHICQIPIC
uniref:Uncharacterized protein n=1 Tax=Rhizophora mucronata TaxID=61149 RepID=A0A2P2QH25_RHIMU